MIEIWYHMFRFSIKSFKLNLLMHVHDVLVHDVIHNVGADADYA